MTEQGNEKEARPSIRLGAWSFYFLIKFLLFWRELIGFHPLENTAFAVFLLAPLSKGWRRVRTVIAIPVAVALLYYDSWLPPVGRVLSQASLLSNFSFAYLMELLGRFISWPVVAMLVIAWGVYGIVARYVRVGVAVMVTLIALAVANAHQEVADTSPVTAQTATADKAGSAAADPDSMLRDFYAAEAQRNVRLPAANGAPFDIIFLHICSLSWDDLRATGLDKHALWSNFDFLFTHFNSAASYSGPAAIRVNRALCGQTTHKGLYDAVSDNCYLFPNLKRAGFETNFAMNHDGHFDDFLALVRRQGIAAPLMPLDGVAIPQRGFDNSPIHDDLGVLSRWLETRQKSPDERVALFYNTISLHDGNTLTAASAPKLNSHDSYQWRADKLFNDINGFMERIKKSGRRAIVVVIPEHGAALRGDKFQIAGLREMATPRITTVPVGVKVIGQDVTRNGDAAQIATSTSYLALSQLIANLIEKTPYGTSGFAPSDYAGQLPVTEYVAENEGTTIMARNGGYLIKQGSEAWKPYVSEAP